jgi:hypothetical protein
LCGPKFDWDADGTRAVRCPETRVGCDCLRLIHIAFYIPSTISCLHELSLFSDTVIDVITVVQVPISFPADTSMAPQHLHSRMHQNRTLTNMLAACCTPSKQVVFCIQRARIPGQGSSRTSHACAAEWPRVDEHGKAVSRPPAIADESEIVERVKRVTLLGALFAIWCGSDYLY